MKSLEKVKSNIIGIINSIIYRIPNIFFIYSLIKVYEFNNLLKNVILSKEDIVLDIGCGEGLQTLIIGKKCKKIYGIDISETKIIKAKIRSEFVRKKVNCEFLNLELKNAQFKNEFFDNIFSICVIEHIPNYIDIFRESFRILKKGGQFIFSVDSFRNFENNLLLKYHKKKFGVCKYFNEIELRNILKQIGFRKIDIYPIFKSNYARKIFTKGIMYGFHKNQIAFVPRYFYLKFKELLSYYKKEGIFLIANCYK